MIAFIKGPAHSMLLSIALLYLLFLDSPHVFSAPVLLVVNQQDRTVSFIDPYAQRQIALLREGDTLGHGHEIAVSPDGLTAYLPIYSDTGVGRPGINGREILVISLRERKIIAHITFRTPVRPHCPIYDPHRNLLYVTTELNNSVTVIDPRTYKIIGNIPTNQPESHMLAISPDGLRGYTANVSSNSVSVLNLKTRRLLTVVTGIGNPQRISVSPDGTLVFVPDQIKPKLAIIDATLNRISKWILLPSVAFSATPSPDGRWLLLALKSANKLAVVDLSTLRITRVVDIPGAPQEIVIPPSGTHAYVSCIRGGQVAVVSLSTWKVEGMIEAGSGADGMAWVP